MKDFLSDKDEVFQRELNKTIFNRQTNYMAYCALRGFRQLHREMRAKANEVVHIYPYILSTVSDKIKYQFKKNYFFYRQSLTLINNARS